MPRALFGICPNRQLNLEEVHALSAELCHERIVGPTQDQQVCFAFQGKVVKGFRPLVNFRLRINIQG